MVMSLCNYKDIFGQPGKGVHSHRFLGIATVDLGLTIVAGLFIARSDFMRSVDGDITRSFVSIGGLIMLSVIIHKMFCVDTVFTRYILG